MTAPSRPGTAPIHHLRRCHGTAPEREAIVHGFARLRLVGTTPIDGIEECPKDDFPKPLPFPTCVRNLPRGGHGHPALDAATCDLVTKRARFDAARDNTGKPVAGTYSNSVTWRIPE